MRPPTSTSTTAHKRPTLLQMGVSLGMLGVYRIRERRGRGRRVGRLQCRPSTHMQQGGFMRGQTPLPHLSSRLSWQG